MIDETNIHSCFSEPFGIIRFANRKLRYDHVRKHVVTQKKEEKWHLLDGFDTETIHAVDEGNPTELERLASRYERYLSETLVRCCKNGTDHLHYFQIYPEQALFLLKREDREPVQYVRCFLFSENLVIIAASYVKDDHFLPYIIKTGFRTFGSKAKKAWQKEQKNRQADKTTMRGKKITLIADHSESQEEFRQ